MDKMRDILQVREGLSCTNRYIYNGINVPRATEIISKCIHEDALVEWSNKLGIKNKSYKEVLSYASDYGTRVHHGIECYLKNLDIPDNTPMIPLESFKNWWRMINQNNDISILGQEYKLVCEWYGGTYDLLIKINDKIYLVDFKTSNHITYKYYIQLASYRKILRDEMSTNIDGCIILQLKKDKPIFREYVLDFSIESHKEYIDICERTFMSMVYTYYHIHYLEKRFKDEYSI